MATLSLASLCVAQSPVKLSGTCAIIVLTNKLNLTLQYLNNSPQPNKSDQIECSKYVFVHCRGPSHGPDRCQIHFIESYQIFPLILVRPLNLAINRAEKKFREICWRDCFLRWWRVNVFSWKEVSGREEPREKS